MNHADYFIELYEKALIEAIRKYPNEYAYSFDAVSGVVSRMGAAFRRGSYNKEGRAIKAVCKFLGIPYTYTAINAYIKQEVTPQ